MKVAFIGGGNMAEALIRGMLERGGFVPADICVADVSMARNDYLAKTFNVAVTTDNRRAVDRAEAVVLAVKPQQAEEVLVALREVFKPEQMLLSICAGLTTVRLEAWCCARVIRAMPNLPALIGRGVTAIAGGSRSRPADLDAAAQLLRGAGAVVSLPEAQMNEVTAISGSGPAFLFAYVEAMEKTALEMGLDRDIAEKLVRETVEGAIQLVKTADVSPAVLRERVSSKGGTTLAGLEAMEQAGFSAAVQAALLAARNRAAELAQS